MAKKRGLEIKINISHRWLYTFIAIGILAIIGVGVYASSYINSVTNTGHDLTEIEPCGDGEILQTSGTSWSCVGMPAESVDTRCDASGTCSQVCIGTECETSWPSGGSSLWTQSGSDISYDGDIIVTGDIMLTGQIKIINKYSYKYDWGGRRDGHTSPRCACDTSDYQDCSYDQTYYTNTNYGSACYDWVDIKYAYNTQYRFPVTYGPYVIQTIG